jgi:hypothetical protein
MVPEKRSKSAKNCTSCQVPGTEPNGAQSECVLREVKGLKGVPGERQRWTERGTFSYAISLNTKPESPVTVRVSAERVLADEGGLNIPTPDRTVGCNVTQGMLLVFSVETWDRDQTVSIKLDDDRAYFAKDAVSFSCNVTHLPESSDANNTYASATMMLDAVSTGCGNGEFFGEFERGDDHRRCVCSAAHFLPLDSECTKCPTPQSDCEERGLLAPRTAEGFWRANPKSPDLAEHPFYVCPFKLACPGGNSTAAQCAKGHDTSTPLCASCLPGYFLAGVSPTQQCRACPERVSVESVTWELAVLTGGGFAVYMMFVMWFVSQPAFTKTTHRLVEERVKSFVTEDGSDRPMHLDTFQNRTMRGAALTRAESRLVFRQIDDQGETPGTREITTEDMRTFYMNRRAELLPQPPPGTARPLPPQPPPLSGSPRLRSIEENGEEDNEEEEGVRERHRRERGADGESLAENVSDNATVLRRMHSRRVAHSAGRVMRVGGLLMKFKLVLGFAQCVAFVPITFSLIPWPETLVMFSDLLHMLTADLMAIFGDVCKLHTGFYLRFMFQMLFLPLLYLVTFVAYAVTRAACFSHLLPCCRRRHALYTLESTRTRLFEILFLGTYTFYTSVSTTIFRVFKCKEIGGEWFLEANYQVECFSGTWWNYAVFAGAGVVVYIVGIPAVLFYLLWRERAYLSEEGCAKSEMPRHALAKRRLGAIYGAYKRESYYFDLVDMLRRLLLTGGLIVLGERSNSQILLGALVCTCWLCVLLARRPYEAQWDNALSSMLAFQLLVIILTGMAMEIHRLTPAFAQDRVENDAFSSLMFFSTVCVLGIGVFTVLFAIPCVQRSRFARTMCCEVEEAGEGVVAGTGRSSRMRVRVAPMSSGHEII